MSIMDMFRKLGIVHPKYQTEGPQATSPLGHIDLIVCQDYEVIPENAKAVGKKLREQGYDVQVESVEHKTELMKRLKARYKEGKPPPTDIFLDVSGGNGSSAAQQAIRYLEKTYPGAPLPEINFCSCDLGMAVDAACALHQADERVTTSAIDSGEISWTRSVLEGKKGNSDYKPATQTLRRLLNRRLETDLSLDHRKNSYVTERLKNLDTVSTDNVLTAWRRGKMPAQEAIDRMQAYMTALAESLRAGFYAQGGQDKIDVAPDAAFYGAAGFPRKGKVVFSLQEVEEARYDSEKPVLVMRNYDPAVVPLMASGMLGGLVVTSTYMASHLKLLCETHMVSGLFGLMPKGQKTLRGEFNEEAAPDGPAFYEGDTAEIAGRKVVRGQELLLCLGGNGISFHPPASVEVKPVDADSINNNDSLKTDIANIRKMKLCFDEWFQANGIKPHGVKANVDSGRRNQLSIVDGIGLVRTEQMVAADSEMIRGLKSALLKDDAYGYETLAWNSAYQYSDMMRKLGEGQPVKIRLYDFVHGEILNKEEQKQFLEKYPRLDIHGGDALRTWPKLYRDQVATIFQALKDVGSENEKPLEIMMPAIRTRQDVLDVKKLVEEEAAKAGVAPGSYSFGTMVETLDACKNIAEIAPLCDFISFGTNDLTQQYTGMSRGDLKAHAAYAEKNGFDPFKVLAPEVLGIVRDTTATGREANPHLRVDVCGGQAADLDTAMKLFDAGVDNVSVAPNLGNLFGLPMLLDYRIYNAARAAQQAPKPVVAAGPTAATA